MENNLNLATEHVLRAAIDEGDYPFFMEGGGLESAEKI